VIGNFDAAHGNANSGWLHLGGWVGIVTAIVAWYASAAGVINGMKARAVLPVGAPLHFGNGRNESPMPRRRLHA
jgi:succinate-acetate transporter protein